MANPENPSDKQRRSGMGQSGYAAGRQVDPAVERRVDSRHVGPPGSGSDGLGTDERFTGRGGPAEPDEPEEPEPPEQSPDQPDAPASDKAPTRRQ
jgi:hypothetical protein